MRKYLMAGVATAALMFGLNQAMAQSSMGGGADKQQGATSAGPSTSPSASGAMNHSKSEGSKTIGQARDQSEPKGMQPPSKMGGDTKADQKYGAGTADHNKQNAQRETDRAKSKTTTGQSRDEMKSDKGAMSPSSGKMGAQPKANENNAQSSSSSNVTTGSASSSATQLTAEQRTEVREKVLVNAPRDNNVNFSVTVGTVVPRTVHVATVPETLIRIHPDWRGHKFFVVHDEIIIVDNDFRIIAVLPV